MYVTEIKKTKYLKESRWQPAFFKYLFFFISSHTPEVHSNHYTVCMFYHTECLSFKVFCLKQSFRASFRRKLGGSAICLKCEQIYRQLSVAYLFFIIYSKSTVGHYKLKISYELHNAYLIQYKYRYIHKQMCQQCTNDHAI